jgi:hypothetical protein
VNLSNPTNPYRAAGQSPVVSVPSPEALQALSRVAILVVSGYIAAQMLADIASLKIGVVAGLAVDMGLYLSHHLYLT